MARSLLFVGVTGVRIKIICVGKIKEKYIQAGIAEYVKRLGSYGSVEIVEVKDEPFKEPLSLKEQDQVMEKEAQRIAKEIPSRAHVIVLDRKGRSTSSLQWANYLQQRMTSGDSQFIYVIGGSLGLHQSVKQEAHWLLSFSELTFPHQLMRLILLEQLYRTATILNGEKYHK